MTILFEPSHELEPPTFLPRVFLVATTTTSCSEISRSNCLTKSIRPDKPFPDGRESYILSTCSKTLIVESMSNKVVGLG